MRSLGLLSLVAALVVLLAGCAVEGPADAESDQLDIEVGRKDNVNGISIEPP